MISWEGMGREGCAAETNKNGSVYACEYYFFFQRGQERIGEERESCVTWGY